MSILEAIRTYMLEFPELKPNSALWSDHSAGDAIQYSIVQIPSTRVLAEYLDGKSDRQYTFAFQSTESTLDELARYENAEFFDKLDAWFEAQTENEQFPTLEANQFPEKIETLSWSYLMQEQSGTGVYQVQCRLLYQQTGD